MKRLLAIVIVFGFGACGDDSPYVPQDDGGMEEQTLTTFVIDLIDNHTGDPAPVAFDAFKDLPDPDGDNNNVTAFAGLFQ